jgi:hypothetical protein
MNLELSVFSYLSESSSNKGAIIGGVVGGVAIVLILLALFVWLRLKKKPKRHPRGEIFWKIFESMHDRDFFQKKIQNFQETFLFNVYKIFKPLVCKF